MIEENKHHEKWLFGDIIPCPYQCDQNCTYFFIRIDQILAVIFGVLSILISGWHISKHLKYFSNQYFQSKIIIILCMAPFYSIISMINLMSQDVARYLTVIRDVYEAFLLFTFFYLIYNYLAYDPDINAMKHEKVYQLMLIPEKGDRQKLIKPLFPMSFCLSPYILSSESKASLFVVKCKKYVLICFIIKPVGALFQILANHYQWEKLQIIVQMVVVVSVCASLYYLVMFYQVIKKPLAPYNPLFKFLVIKITLFFTFWQEITLKITEPEILTCFSGASQRVDEQIMIGLENILVCFEMFIMSIVAGHAFTFHEFKIFGVNRGNFKGAVQDMIDTFKTDVYVIQIKPNPIKHKTYEVPLNVYDGRISQTALGQQQSAQLRTSSIAEIEMTPQNTNQQIKKKKKDLNDYLLLNHH